MPDFGPPITTGPLTIQPPDANLDLDAGIGQRDATFRFDLVDGITGQVLRELTPLVGASLSHDTSRVIKRQLNLQLGTSDTAMVDVVNNRVLPYMVFGNGDEYPLGRYLFTDASREQFTSGQLGSFALTDEMFLVDQQLERGINARGRSTTAVIQDILAGLPVTYDLEASPFFSAESWGVGTGRGQVLEALSVTGDYFSPWFGNDTKLHFVRSFDPGTSVPDFNFDSGNKVIRAPIVQTDDLLTAPNRFVVISNAADSPALAAVGRADVPNSAPHSIPNRGFVVSLVLDLQLSNAAQAGAVAQNMANRLTLFERVQLTTAPDPRHDSYDVVVWQDELWLEIGWSMQLMEGASMNHSLRKAYTQ